MALVLEPFLPSNDQAPIDFLYDPATGRYRIAATVVNSAGTPNSPTAPSYTVPGGTMIGAYLGFPGQSTTAYNWSSDGGTAYYAAGASAVHITSLTMSASSVGGAQWTGNTSTGLSGISVGVASSVIPVVYTQPLAITADTIAALMAAFGNAAYTFTAADDLMVLRWEFSPPVLVPASHYFVVDLTGMTAATRLYLYVTGYSD